MKLKRYTFADVPTQGASALSDNHLLKLVDDLPLPESGAGLYAELLKRFALAKSIDLDSKPVYD